jgi:NhaP-type Na+/H+ or K+/H+ antiporter
LSTKEVKCLNDLSFLYPIGFIFVVGVVLSFLVHRFRLPSPLFLLLGGILLGRISLAQPFLVFPKSFVVGLSVVALAMIAYDVFSRSKLRSNDSYAHSAVKSTVICLGFSLFFLSVLIALLGIVDDPIKAMLASAIISGISAPFLAYKSVRLHHFMDSEVTVNAALVLFVCLIFLGFLAFTSTHAIITSLLYYMAVFTLQILVGLGAGIFFGLVVFKVFRSIAKTISHLALLAVVLSSYLFAELIGGSGFFAVMSLALLFGTLTIRHRAELEEFSHTFSEAIEILLLILLGLIVALPITTTFLMNSLLVFAMDLALRYVGCSLALRHHNFSERERWLMATAPKGLVVAAIALNTILVSSSLLPVIQVVVACLVYSQLLSWAVNASQANRG